MKPSRRLRHPAWSGHAVQCANAASVLVLMLALSLPCAQATEAGAAVSSRVDNAGALNVTPPSASDAEQADAQTNAETDVQVAAAPAAPAASVFEDVLRDQDPAEVPLSLALMGGVLGMLYIRRRKR